MKTLEIIAASVTTVLALVGLWTVVMAVRVAINLRKIKNKGGNL
jgi:hypothetical protein